MPKLFRTSRALLLLGLLCVTTACTGCTPVLLLGYLIGGPPMQDPDFHVRTKKHLEDAKKPIVVLCYAPDEIRLEHSAVDYELSRYVAMQLNRKQIKVVDPDKVRAWLDRNPDFQHDWEPGEFFKAAYVIHVDLRSYSLMEENSSNLYRGRANLVVDVWECGKDGKWSPIFDKTLKSQFPTAVPYSADEMPMERFKLLYLTNLSDEIGKLFYAVPTGTEIGNRALN